MKLVDTHCHIHDTKFYTNEEAENVLVQSVKNGVDKLVLIGTSLEDSRAAVAFANKHPEYCWASIGIHPHEAANLSESEITSHLEQLSDIALEPKVVAVGECGFDFYYNDKRDHIEKQEQLLRGQIELALNNNLPLSFHVREAS